MNKTADINGSQISMVPVQISGLHVRNMPRREPQTSISERKCIKAGGGDGGFILAFRRKQVPVLAIHVILSVSLTHTHTHKLVSLTLSLTHTQAHL